MYIVNEDQFPREATVAAQPRLGVAHLLVWMTGSAAILAIQRAQGQWDGYPQAQRWFYLALAVPQSMVWGAVVGSLAVGIVRRLQGRIFPVHPGQWIALLWGSMAVALWLGMAVLFLLSDGTGASSTDDPLFKWQFGFFAALQVLTAATCMVVAGVGRLERRWRVLLVVLAVETALIGLCFFAVATLSAVDFMNGLTGAFLAANLVQMLGGLATVAVLGVCVTGDVRRRIERDWMHYVGVAAVLWNVVWAWLQTMMNMISGWLF